MRRFAAILCALVFCAAAAGQTPGFWLVGMAPGGSGSQVLGLSADGSVACGASYSGAGFTWTRQGGRYDYGLEPGMPQFSHGWGLSSDAGVLAGVMRTLPAESRAFRRVGNGPLVDLGVVPGNTRSYSRAISGDGSVVVGGCEWSQFNEVAGQAFRWTEQGGIQGLGYTRPGGNFSQAQGISRDGTTIVGVSQSGGSAGPRDAFVWREGAGMQALPGLPGSTGWNAATAVNADGSVIVGQAETTGQHLRAARWTSSGIQDLGVPPGYHESFAKAVSGDGNVIGGQLSNFTAFLWTPSTGILPLSDYLTSLGISLPAGHKLSAVTAISADGLTLAGYTLNLQTTEQEGFVATIPAPASCLILLLLPALRRRRPHAA